MTVGMSIRVVARALTVEKPMLTTISNPEATQVPRSIALVAPASMGLVTVARTAYRRPDFEALP